MSNMKVFWLCVIGAGLIVAVFSGPIFGQNTAENPGIRMINPATVRQVDPKSEEIQSRLGKNKTESIRLSGKGSSSAIPGVIVVDDEPGIVTNKKEILFVTARTIQSNSYVIQQIEYSNGDIQTVGATYVPYEWGEGIGMFLHNGEFSFFTPGGPAIFRIIVVEPDNVSYVDAHSPIWGDESYFFPKINWIEDQMNTGPRKITLRGTFVAQQPVKIMVNWSINPNIQLLPVTARAIQFFVPPEPNFYLPRAKYRITVCQQNICDSMIARP